MAGELYLPVRLKPRDENSLDGLLNNGVDHIELRMFDLNPLEKLGIAQEDFDFTPYLQEQLIRNHQNAALYDISDVSIDGVYITEAANSLLDKIEKYF